MILHRDLFSYFILLLDQAVQVSKLAWPFRFMRLHPSLKSGQIFCVFSAAHGVFLIVFAGG